MTPWCGVFRTPNGGTMWASIAFAARHHPDAALRERLASMVQALIATPESREARQRLRKIIGAEKGTPLEPFMCDGADADMAAVLGAVTLRPPINGSRFRVVSRDTLTEGGGLVITRALQHYFAERYVRGTTRGTPKQASFIAPGNEPSIDTVRDMLNPVTGVDIEPDGEGMAIRIHTRYTVLGSASELLGSNRSRAIAMIVNGARRPLRGGDVSFNVEADDAVIRPASPEGLMRLGAAGAGNVTLVIGGQGVPAVLAVRLAPVEEEPRPVPFGCAVAFNPFADWLSLVGWQAPTLEADEETAIGRWLAPHNDWNAVGSPE